MRRTAIDPDGFLMIDDIDLLPDPDYVMGDHAARCRGCEDCDEAERQWLEGGLEAASRKQARYLRDQLAACRWLNGQLRDKVTALQGELADAELAAAEKGRL